MTCTILVSGNDAVSNTTAVRWRKSHEGVPVNMVHFKLCSCLNKLVARWQKENMSTLQKIPTHMLLFSPLSSYLVVILLSLSGVCMQKSHQVTNSHVVWRFLYGIHFILKKILNERGSSQAWEVKEVNAAFHILHTGMKTGLTSLSVLSFLSLQVFMFFSFWTKATRSLHMLNQAEVCWMKQVW